MTDTLNPMVLALLNSCSPDYVSGRDLVLPYLDHLGVPYELVDLARQPLPPGWSQFALLVVAHARVDPRGLLLGRGGYDRLSQAIDAGLGLVSFDPGFGSAAEMTRVETDRFEMVGGGHYITGARPAGEAIPLASPGELPVFASSTNVALVMAAGKPFLTTSTQGKGRTVRWASNEWMAGRVLGPVAGLDDLFWRGLVWAARKPFALRGQPPLLTMRVDDVAGRGIIHNQSPLYWVRGANGAGFKPWLGLFIYDLSPVAVDELRGFIQAGQVTAAPHAFGRRLRVPGRSEAVWQGLPPGVQSAPDEFIYFDHWNRQPLTDAEAQMRLDAVDGWYNLHAPLPKSRFFVPHWYELGHNAVDHLVDRWGVEFTGTILDVDQAYQVTPHPLKMGPFQASENAVVTNMEQWKRPLYYADFVNLGGRRLFNCVTEIRDVSGYEWFPTNDVRDTVERGVRQLRRAMDSMVLATLFTHEIPDVETIEPSRWEAIMAAIAAEMADTNPIYVTMDEATRQARAVRTSRFRSARYDVNTGAFSAEFSGVSDALTYFYLFSESQGHIRSSLESVSEFAGTGSVKVSVGG